MPVSTLEHDAARDMMRRPFNDVGVRFHPEAMERLIAFTGGHPYYLILYLEEIAALLNRRPTKWEVTVRDVAKSARGVLEHPLCFASAVNEPGGTPEQHACLRALAKLQASDDTPVGRSRIAHAAKLSSDAADAALERMSAFDLLERHITPGFDVRYAFAIPIVRAWVQRNRYDLSERSLLAGGLR